MKITKRQLKRLIESNLFEQQFANQAEEDDAIGSDEGEYIEEEEADKKRNNQIVEEAYALIVSGLSFMKQGKYSYTGKPGELSKDTNFGRLMNFLEDFTGASGGGIVNHKALRDMDGPERLKYVENRLKQLDGEYSESSAVLDQKIGLLYMEKHPGLERAAGDITGEQKNLGDFLVDKVGYKNLSGDTQAGMQYPTLYRIYQASV